jgi:hypothetical protein
MGSFTNPLASFTSDAFTPDSLILSLDDLVSRKVTIKQSGALVRGSLLGKITLGAATSAAKAGGNTGTGTLVLDVTTPILANANRTGAGVYTVRCTVAGANAATFLVVDPLGVSLGTVSFSGSGASATFSDRIKFAITDGGTDFIVGDGFDITIAPGSGKYVLATSAAVDGSQTPDAILYADTDASAADAEAMGYFRGRFNQGALTFSGPASLHHRGRDRRLCASKASI